MNKEEDTDRYPLLDSYCHTCEVEHTFDKVPTRNKTVSGRLPQRLIQQEQFSKQDVTSLVQFCFYLILHTATNVTADINSGCIALVTLRIQEFRKITNNFIKQYHGWQRRVVVVSLV